MTRKKQEQRVFVEPDRRPLAAEGVLNVVCSNCNAQPGKMCTQPTDTGRKAVPWVHVARADLIREIRMGALG